MFSVSVEWFYSDNNEEHVVQSRLFRNLRDHADPLNLPDNMFIKFFRLSKVSFVLILSKMNEKLPGSKYNTGLPNIIKLSGFLRFMAERSYQRGTGADYNVAIAQSTFSKNLRQMLNFFEEEICPHYIKFDVSNEEKTKIKLSFYQKYGFPGTIGVIDGTHVRIMSPGEEIKHLYYNRKGFYSLNVMVVCDDKQLITYLDSNHPGASHDSFIFNNSFLSTTLQQRFTTGDRSSWLLEDAGYPLKTYLITPYRVSSNNQNHEGKTIFNKKHCRARKFQLFLLIIILNEIIPCSLPGKWTFGRRRNSGKKKV